MILIYSKTITIKSKFSEMKKIIIAEKRSQFFLVLLMAVTIVGCAPSTQIEKSWREPGATVKKDGSKSLVLAMVKDETSRRVIEDNLVKRIGTGAVASYTFITPDMLKEANSTKFYDQLVTDKYTHVILIRLADIEKETSYVPGSSMGFYGGYGMYYGYGAAMYGSPGYYTTDKNYFVETAVFSVSPDKLLWTGTTKTVNPSKIEQTITDIANVVSEKMIKDGFLLK